MNIQNTIEIAVKKAIKSIYNADINTVEFQATRKDFDGDITIVIFALFTKSIDEALSSTNFGNHFVQYAIDFKIF